MQKVHDLAEIDLHRCRGMGIIQVRGLQAQVGTLIRPKERFVGAEDLNHVSDVDLIAIRIVPFADAGKNGMLISF